MQDDMRVTKAGDNTKAVLTVAASRQIPVLALGKVGVILLQTIA